MKKLIFASVLFMSAFFAQAQVSVNVNIGTPPNWGPQGYDNSRYYYLPDIDVYYDINQSVFIYANSGKWIRERRLPSVYRNYDLYSGYKVVLTDYRGNTPYYYHSKHRAEYPKGYHGKPQKNRGEKPKGNNGNHYGNNKGNSGNNGNGNSQGNNKSDKNHDHGNGKHH